MTTIGFIGLGIMGRPMARNLVAAGFDAVDYDHHQENIDSHVAAGGRGAGSIGTAADGAGIAVIDAPVSGGEAGAVSASLSILIGGAAEDVSRAAAVLEAIGKTIVHVGPAAAGQTVKAANQLLGAGTIELVAEAIVVLRAHDVDEAAAVHVLARGLAGNAILDRKAPSMLAHDFSPGFRIDLHHKDMGIVASAARAAGVAIPLGDHVEGLIASLRAQDYGHLDHGALLLLVEQLSGRAPDPEPGRRRI